MWLEVRPLIGSSLMSGQSWSRREAPWGARAIYSASARANASITGPGMVIAKKKNVRVAKDDMLAERAVRTHFACGWQSQLY